MKTLCALVLLLALASVSTAQVLSSSVIAASGGEFTSGAGSLEWTLGEIMTETYQQGSRYLTQGFHQPAFITVTGMEEPAEKNLSIYPNPVTSSLYVKTNETGEYHFEVFDLQGQRVVNQNTYITNTHIHEIDMLHLASAMYLMRISNNTSGKSTYHKVVKE